MAETIKYGRIGEEDLELQQNSDDSTFSVVLPDGREATLNKVSLDSFTAFGTVPFNLQQAQSFVLEILTSNPSTNTQGRIYLFDTTDDIIRYMDGTNVRDVVITATAQTLTNKTLTAPIIDQILDSNSNESLDLPATTGAVNFVRVENATTGNDPTVSAQGDDTDIDLDLRSKGSGVVRSNGEEIQTNVIPSGTRMFFDQDTAPTGWTRITTIDDRVPMIVSGARSDGGTWTVGGLTTDDPGTHTHGAGTYVVDSHTHSLPRTGWGTGGTAIAGKLIVSDGSASPPTNADHSADADNTSGGSSPGLSGSSAGDGAHTHTISSDASWRPLHRDIILCSRD